MKQFSVITSVYKNDKEEFVRVALDSMLVNQSAKPAEIVLVQDGPVSENLSGLRFEKQIRFLEEHPDVDLVGGQITEFIGTADNIVGKREVPCDNGEIYQYMRSRCALNHPTVMFKRESVLNAGNYQDWFWNEDYYMWIRMMERGCIFANLPDVLVNMRSGFDQYGRRGGKKYFDSEIGIKKLMLEKGMITRREYIINYFVRLIIQLVLPSSLRGWVFRTFARKK